MQAGLDNLPDDKRIYIVKKISDTGAFEFDLSVAAIEDEKVVPIKVD